ncbi:amino acid adenylation domain-containing protein, partial [Nostoc sp.]|uniref:amino acid adenylation domain-containing protein n=1 Tax=Nostoc sp. TaxID=1180 RepID=UPI002FFCB111
KFDLTLDLCERNDQLHCTWEYATDLFEADTIHRMVRHFEVLLEAIAQNPQQPISKLPLITTAEIQQLQLWNQTNTDYPKNQTLVTLFEQQVAQTPNNIAVVFEDQRLSYQELNQKANQLAYSLLELRTEQQLPDNQLIAICVERSLEMVIGLFGILKAGEAYVPIDPNYPQERIRFMLEDCGAKVLLTHSQLKDQLPLAELERQYQVLCLDEDKFAKQSTNNPSCQSQPNDLAYVIYTSGSTGRPKGVQLLHRGLSNYLHWAKDYYAIAQGIGAPVQSSLSFDATITSLYLPLICGRTTILIREKQELETLADTVKQNNHLSLVKITPSHLEILNQQLDPNAMQNRVNAFVLGGEALHANQIIPWLTYAPDTRLINEYGPTEAVVGCCVYEATGKMDLLGDLLIGQPIANVRIYILDNQNQPLPPGIPGELCIAGAGLARGYLNCPELTAEKFIELDLFGEQERVYKTGDLARWLPDGNLEYLGRIDNQVKLRGFRIELGEIEALLAKHPKIQQAVVILQGEDAIDKRLLAYIVPTPIDKDLEDKSLQAEQVELWQQVFSDSYSQQQAPTDDPTLNLAGWNDSYTGKPIPQAAMQEWRDTTVVQILELEAKRIWEIGCGTGLLLFKIAPHCQHYLGTDFSPEALHYIEQHLKEQSLNDRVTLKASAANQFDGIETNAYDLVIMNSVIQYFPSLDYFLEVLEGAVKAVTTHGSIFIGDVRNLLLLEAFYTAVEFYRAPDELSIQDLRQQIQKSIRNEGELLIDPNFFIALKQRIPRISHVQIQLQRGYAQTEMSRFRYDVVLHLDQTISAVAEPQWLDWQSHQQLNLETIERILTTQQPDLLGIKDIPNARLTLERVLLEQIAQLDGTVSDLKAALAQAKSGIELEAFRTLARDLPYTPFIEYSPTGFSYYNVVFQRNIPGQVTLPRFAIMDNLRLKPWQHYANQPLQYRPHQVDPALLAEWQDFLGKTLPEYMIPSHFTVLEQLPLTPNGKVDRLALPAPNCGFEGLYEAPGNQVEQQLAQVWSAVLELQEIGIHDNFFDLGGHSLLAIKLLNHIQQVFEQKLSLSSLFQNPTIAQLAQQLCDPEIQQSNPDLLSLQPQGNATPLFCLPGANGHAFYFRDLAMNLGTERPVYGLETPGRDGLSPLPDSVAAYASQMIELLRQQQVKSPYILAGYSSGCAVAFEMAAQLEQHGETVSLLAILDAGLVSQPKHITDRTELDWIWHMIERIRVIKGVSLGLEYDRLAAQPNDQDRWDLAAEYLYRYNVLPEHSTVSLLKTNLRVMKLLTLNYATYQPNYRICAPIVLFRAQEVKEIVVQELQAISRYDVPDWGWQTYTQKPVRVISVPGNHGQMLYGSNAKILAAQLQNFMT